jgi:hypothetical protein
VFAEELAPSPIGTQLFLSILLRNRGSKPGILLASDGVHDIATILLCGWKGLQVCRREESKKIFQERNS